MYTSKQQWCDSGYQAFTSACSEFGNDAKKQWCNSLAKNGAVFETVQECREFCKSSATNCPSLIEAGGYCTGDNLNKGYCKSICGKKYNCDELLTSYCSSGNVAERRNLDICSCFLPTSYYETYYNRVYSYLPTGIGAYVVATQDTIPECSYRQCATTGVNYKFNRYTKTASCPKKLLCVQYLDLSNVVAQNINVYQQLNCGDEEGIGYCDPGVIDCPTGYGCDSNNKCINGLREITCNPGVLECPSGKTCKNNKCV